MGTGLAVSPDQRYGARGFGRVVRIWDLASGERVADLLGHTSDITAVAFSGDGKFIVSGARDGDPRSLRHALQVTSRTCFVDPIWPASNCR